MNKLLRSCLGLLLAVFLLFSAALADTEASTTTAYLEAVAALASASPKHGEAWSMAEKRELLRLMADDGLIATQAAAPEVMTDDEVDALLLARYGAEDHPGDTSVLSFYRIAWVELGPNDEWSNDTWVWFTDLLFRTGLVNEHSDVDVYLRPDDSAIAPEEAIRRAEAALLTSEVVSADALADATVQWFFLTHASDVKHEHLQYAIVFRLADGAERTLWLSPVGELVD